jgi:hypothetical protein
MTWLQWAEALSYIVTILGLPMAILVFMYEQRGERQGEEEELCQRLSDEYTRFLKVVLGNPNLQLLCKGAPDQPLTDEQKERKLAIHAGPTSPAAATPTPLALDAASARQ